MSALARVILVGCFSEVIELCNALGVEIVGVIDRDPDSLHDGERYLGDDSSAAQVLGDHVGTPVHITPDNPLRRTGLSEMYLALGVDIATLVHPRANVSPSAHIGDGSIIQAGASVSADTVLGRGVKVNTGANVTHDVRVGDFSSIAPGALILSRCQLGRRVYVGGNATILPGISVGDDALIGAGSVVTRNVPPGAIVYGNPARPRGQQ